MVVPSATRPPGVQAEVLVLDGKKPLGVKIEPWAGKWCTEWAGWSSSLLSLDVGMGIGGD